MYYSLKDSCVPGTSLALFLPCLSKGSGVGKTCPKSRRLQCTADALLSFDSSTIKIAYDENCRCREMSTTRHSLKRRLRLVVTSSVRHQHLVIQRDGLNPSDGVLIVVGCTFGIISLAQPAFKWIDFISICIL